jgi:hypothetical protein
MIAIFKKKYRASESKNRKKSGKPHQRGVFSFLTREKIGKTDFVGSF